MKKIIYIAAFTALGLLTQFILHAAIEIWYIGLLLSNFNKYGLGLNWNQWVLIHHAGTVLLLIAGIAAGFWQGKFWWKKIYETAPNNRG
jgi:hypothetical protein